MNNFTNTKPSNNNNDDNSNDSPQVTPDNNLFSFGPTHLIPQDIAANIFAHALSDAGTSPKTIVDAFDNKTNRPILNSHSFWKNTYNQMTEFKQSKKNHNAQTAIMTNYYLKSCHKAISSTCNHSSQEKLKESLLAFISVDFAKLNNISSQTLTDIIQWRDTQNKNIFYWATLILENLELYFLLRKLIFTNKTLAKELLHSLLEMGKTDFFTYSVLNLCKDEKFYLDSGKIYDLLHRLALQKDHANFEKIIEFSLNLSSRSILILNLELDDLKRLLELSVDINSSMGIKCIRRYLERRDSQLINDRYNVSSIYGINFHFEKHTKHPLISAVKNQQWQLAETLLEHFPFYLNYWQENVLQDTFEIYLNSTKPNPPFSLFILKMLQTINSYSELREKNNLRWNSFKIFKKALISDDAIIMDYCFHKMLRRSGIFPHTIDFTQELSSKENKQQWISFISFKRILKQEMRTHDFNIKNAISIMCSDITLRYTFHISKYPKANEILNDIVQALHTENGAIDHIFISALSSALLSQKIDDPKFKNCAREINEMLDVVKLIEREPRLMQTLIIGKTDMQNQNNNNNDNSNSKNMSPSFRF